MDYEINSRAMDSFTISNYFRSVVNFFLCHFNENYFSSQSVRSVRRTGKTNLFRFSLINLYSTVALKGLNLFHGAMKLLITKFHQMYISINRAVAKIKVDGLMKKR